MKQLKSIFVMICIIVFITSCNQKKKADIKEFNDVLNKYDKEKVDELLADDFILIEKKQKLNKAAFLKRIDSLKDIGSRAEILSINENDSIIKTEERISSLIDSILEVNPKLVLKKTYKIENEKIKSITVDTASNFENYVESLTEKMTPLFFYVNEQHEIKDANEILKNIKKYLLEYALLTKAERKKYTTYAGLQGTYISKKSLYPKLVFKGKSTVVVYDAFIGFPFPTSYVVDEQYIRIRTDKSDLLLEIKDNNTLIGEGWATGKYVKVVNKN